MRSILIIGLIALSLGAIPKRSGGAFKGADIGSIMGANVPSFGSIPDNFKLNITLESPIHVGFAADYVYNNTYIVTYILNIELKVE